MNAKTITAILELKEEEFQEEHLEHAAERPGHGRDGPAGHD